MKNLKWFELASIANVGVLKALYKALVYKHHPDHEGGNLKNMQEINDEYTYAFEWVKAHPFAESDTYANKHHKMEDGFREVIAKVIFIPNIHVEINGSWIWISGDTKPVKDIIKSAGFEWGSKKKMWYWKPSDYVKKGKTNWSYEKIQAVYGSQHVPNDPRPQL